MKTQLIIKQAFENSIKSIKKAIELNPLEINFYIDIANCYKENRDYQNALIYLKKAIKIDNQSYVCHYNIADIYDKLNKFEFCLFHLQKAIKIFPESYDALFSMARYYKKMNNEKKMLMYLHKTLEKMPEHPGANHLLASHNKDISCNYSLEYTKDLFDRYAGHFEEHLVSSLKYQVPFIIKEKLKYLNSPKCSKILDLGCGTGLIGKNIVDLFPNLVGVDISANMIEETRKKNIYNTLHVNDIHDFLLKNVQGFDLIIAADVFIYIGNLQIIFSRVKKSLNYNAYFIFTLELFSERSNEKFHLEQSGRYSHSIVYIDTLCETFGFEVIDKEEIILRQQNKIGQKGIIYILKSSI